MKAFIFLFAILAALSLGSTYSKYGRTCRDIGCVSNEVCVLKEDPCTRASRHTGCGSYPACQRVNNSPATCSTFVCPPTQRCQITNGAPKCVAKVASGRHKRLVQNYNYGSSSNYAPSAPPSPVNSNYPSYPINSNYPSYPINSNTPIPRLYPALPSPVQPFAQTPRPLNYGQNSNNYYPYQTTLRSNYGNQGRPVYPAYNQSQNNNYYNTRNQNQINPTQRYPGYPTQSPYYGNQRYPNQAYPTQDNQRYPNQAYPVQPYPTQRPLYPTQNNQRYPNQRYPNVPNSNYPYGQGQGPYSPSGRNYPAQQNYYNNMYQSPNNDQQSNTLWVASSSNRVVRQTHNYPSAGATYPSNSHVYNPNPQYNQQPNYNPQYPNQNNYNNPNQLHNQTHGIYPNLQIGQTSPPNYYQGSSVGGMHQSNQHPNYYPGQGVVGGVNHGNQSPNYHQGQVGVGGAYQPPNYNQGGVQQPQFGQVGQTRPGYPNSGNTAGSNDFYVSQTQGNRQPVGTGGATYPSQGVQGQRYPIQPGYQGGNYQRAH